MRDDADDGALPVVTLPDPEWADDLAPLVDGWTTTVWDVDSPPPEALGGRVRAVVLPYLSAAGALDRLAELPALALVQALTTGYDGLPEKVPAHLTLASAAGIHDASTAELAVGLALASLRGIDDAVRDADAGRWRHSQRPSLADRRVLVVGVGGVGAAVVDRLTPFEVEITRVASRARDDERGHVHGADELPALLPDAEVVVLVTSLTPSTRGMVDARFLAAMPDGALLVNVGRGPVVDTPALLAELRRGRIKAALDVVDPEPLPEGHPLWGVPGLLLVPHLGGDTTAMRPRALALLRDQLGRLARGEELRNVVSR
jgi:phosphoglycerate dehydrogenase-like enzyme